MNSFISFYMVYSKRVTDLQQIYQLTPDDVFFCMLVASGASRGEAYATIFRPRSTKIETAQRGAAQLAKDKPGINKLIRSFEDNRAAFLPDNDSPKSKKKKKNTETEEEEKAGRVPQLLYSDEDKCDGEAETFYEPHFKEKFNLDLILSNNYICHFMVMKRELMQQLLERGEYNGAQDYDLVLRAAFALSGREEAICHIPKVLYHWRCHSLSTAENPKSKLYAYEAGRRAVQDFVNQKGWKAEVQHTEHLGFYRVEYPEGVFTVRAEVGAAGGAVVKGGKIVGGQPLAHGVIQLRPFAVYHRKPVRVPVVSFTHQRLAKTSFVLKPQPPCRPG